MFTYLHFKALFVHIIYASNMPAWCLCSIQWRHRNLIHLPHWNYGRRQSYC